jgi:aryl-alcohol dehydrogenase-like predicted oxidoreductase
MHLSVEASLKKLRTSYIDILYVHWWDWDTSVEEAMNGLLVLVQQGKVLYLVSVISMLTSTLANVSMGRVQSQSVCSGSWENTVCDLPRCLECHASGL